MKPYQELRKSMGIRSLLFRLSTVGFIALLMIISFIFIGGWIPITNKPNSKQFLQAFEMNPGQTKGFRRNHAKGVCVTGYFVPSQDNEFSHLDIFNQGDIPVVGRFAVAGSNPYIKDNDQLVKSMALDFQFKNGEEWRTGMNALPVFSVNTPEAFYEQIIASLPESATNKPNPKKMSAFLVNHPETVQARELIKNWPKSKDFYDATYNSLNTFYFRNNDNQKIPARWSMIPILKNVSTSKFSTILGSNYMFDGLINQLRQEPLKWTLQLILAAPEDKINDATIPFPANRTTVTLGTLILNHVSGEDTGSCRDINYDPIILPNGIKPSNDPLLSARSSVYSRSYTKRMSELKHPSAIQ